MDAVEAAYLSAVDRLGQMTLDEFRRAVSKCDIHPVEVRGRIAGAIVVSGPEIHACVLPWAHGGWIGRRMLGVLDSVIKTHGYAQTTATTEQGRRFVERLGFQRVGNVYRKVGLWASKHC